MAQIRGCLRLYLGNGTDGGCLKIYFNNGIDGVMYAVEFFRHSAYRRRRTRSAIEIGEEKK